MSKLELHLERLLCLCPWHSPPSRKNWVCCYCYWLVLVGVVVVGCCCCYGMVFVVEELLRVILVLVV
jgi:hypothetical protein